MSDNRCRCWANHKGNDTSIRNFYPELPLGLIFLKIFKFGYNYRLKGTCKKVYRGILCTLYLTSSNVNILPNQSTNIKPRKLTLVQSIELIQILPVIQARVCVCVYVQFFHMYSFMRSCTQSSTYLYHHKNPCSTP